MRKWISEPLVHFLVLGSVLFLFFQLTGDQNTEKPDEITITNSTIDSLVLGFSKTWQRPPAEQELQGLVNEYIREEVLYREAIAMGLDRGDTIIRRRMRQKMEFLFEDISALKGPSEEDLREYLAENPGKFSTEPEFSFTHIYLNPEKHRESLMKKTGLLLEKLRSSGINSPTYGDTFMLPHSFTGLSLSEVKNLFGKNFAEKLTELKPGQWHGPVDSGYGTHLVLVRDRTEGRVPPLDEIQDEVKRELLHERRRKVNEETYQRLRDRYTVVFESEDMDAGMMDTAEAR